MIIFFVTTERSLESPASRPVPHSLLHLNLHLSCQHSNKVEKVTLTSIITTRSISHVISLTFTCSGEILSTMERPCDDSCVSIVVVALPTNSELRMQIMQSKYTHVMLSNTFLAVFEFKVLAESIHLQNAGAASSDSV
jgi:hypothetical protein